MMDFSSQFKRLRKQNGMTQAQVAALLGVSKSTICNYESGYSTPHSLEKLEIIAALFGVTVDILLGKIKTDISEPGNKKSSLIRVPILPIVEGDSEDNKMELPRSLLGEGDFIAVRITDDALSSVSYQKGDIVFCRRDLKPADGELAAVLVNSTTLLLRYLYYSDDTVSLVAAGKMPPSVYPAEEVIVLGLAVKSLASI